MSYIVFDSEPKFSYLGGGTYLPDISLWPRTPKSNIPMMPLLTLDNSFFFIQTLNSNDWAMTVFISVKYNQEKQAFEPFFTRHFTANDQEAYDNYACEYTKILLHKKGETEIVHPEINYPLFPKTFIGLRNETEEELKEEFLAIDDTGQGFDKSKAFVMFHFLQDTIRIKPNEFLALQVNQFDLDEISHQHQGILGDGLGYVVWNLNLKKFTENREVGKFFIQTT